MTSGNVDSKHIEALTVAWERLGPHTGPPVVILHGLGDSSIMTFRPIALDIAASGTPALLVDFPGFGYSSAPASWPSTTEDQAGIVVSLLDKLGITRTPIIGHSMGGSVAILISARRPDLVSRLVVAEPLLLPEQSALGKSISKRTKTWFVERGFDMLKLATHRQAARGDLAARGFQQPLEHANPLVMYKTASSLLKPCSPGFQARLKRLQIPRTLLIGDRTQMETIGVEDSGVTITRIPGSGHSMMSENPPGFSKATRDALNCGPARSTPLRSRSPH